MDLKEKIVSSFLAFEDSVDLDSSVHELRSEAIKKFEDHGFPTKKGRSLEIHITKCLAKG